MRKARRIAGAALVLLPLAAHAAASTGKDLEQAFWQAPGWPALERYAESLRQRHPGIPPQGPWPRDEGLERMKAHLALGLKGPKPGPYADWAQLKHKAAQDLALNRGGKQVQGPQGGARPALSQRALRMQGLADELQRALGLWGPLHDAISAEGGAARVVRLVRALEFPEVAPSLFRSEAEIAPPGSTAEQASGRFDIVFLQHFTPRPGPAAKEDAVAGLYDMQARTQQLVRAVQRVSLFRDGRLGVDKRHLRSTETLWREVDGPMCEGWVPGFSFGEADAAIWRFFDTQFPGGGRQNKRLNHAPAGSLYAFHTTVDMPPGPATRNEVPMKLERKDTGFVRGVYLLYDLDRDGTPDIAAWEGQGKGPGHLDGPSVTDDRWYRLVLVNIQGAWKVLGSDSFSYGCGC